MNRARLLTVFGLLALVSLFCGAYVLAVLLVAGAILVSGAN